MQSNTITAEVIQRLVRAVINRHTETRDYERAKVALIALGLYDEAIERIAVAARIERWRRQCNAVVAYKERVHSDEWFQLKIDKQTEEKLEDWIIGKSIGVIKEGMLIVVANGVSIPVMPKEYAEIVVFDSFDGVFKLAYADDTNEMVISQFVRRR
ncbi:MAG: hypothetical protein ABWX90_01470 [Candidatus Saccharimonadales bacterium]